ncbi:PRC-barrel domain-containing protein [Candidatus Parcubacteria bacterium]|nr:PRC-barrel domain-containing protein [Candidatus Parcubacteria bacterium]
MIVRFGLLRRGPVFLGSGSGPIGFVKDAVMMPASFRVVAFSVLRRWWRKPQWFVPAAILVLTAEAIRLASDSGFAVDGVPAGATALRGKPVHTVSGARLGRVRDFAFSSDTGEVVELTVVAAPLGPCWPRECVVEREAVVRIERERIIVRDSTIPASNSKVALRGLHS